MTDEDAPEQPAKETGRTERIGMGDLIGNTDNPANWWRSQLIAWALPAELDDQLRTWTRDSSMVIGGYDRAHRLLRSAALISAYAADGDGWRSAMGMLAGHLLIRSDGTTDAAEVKDLLATLHQSGASKLIRDAVRRVVNEGPALAVHAGARDIRPHRSTHTRASADLAYLVGAGDVIDPSQADELCRWAIAVIREPAEYVGRTRPTFLVGTKLRELMAAVVPAANLTVQQTVIDFLLEDCPKEGSLEDQDVARIVWAIPEDAWTDERLDQAVILTAGSNGRTAKVLKRLAAQRRPEVHQAVIDRADAGDLGSLSSLGPVTELRSDTAAALIASLSDTVDRLTEHARRGLYLGGGMDVVRELTLLNCWHSGVSNWSPVLAALSEPALQSDQLVDAITLLARLPEKVPSGVRGDLIDVLERLRIRPIRDDLIERLDVRGPAFEALWALGARPSLLQCLVGDPAERRSAAVVIGREELTSEVGVLALLTQDTEPGVRSAAANALGVWAAKGLGGHEVVRLCEGLLADSGTLIAKGLANALVDRPTLADQVVPLKHRLMNHPSAQIRALFADPHG